MITKENLIEKVLSPIYKAGYQVYFVGGCVRDELMGKEPHDYDITTEATPKDLHKVFDKFSNVSKNSEQFGVTMPLVDINGELVEIEIATFRKDETKGRHPKVSLDASIEEDAMRRDFTINALYENMEGAIIDPTGRGLHDIRDNKLYFVGNPHDRLLEDPLRAFRFVRFLSQKGFECPYTVEEMQDMTGDLTFTDVSKERVLKEFKQILAGKWFSTKTVQDAFFAMRVADVSGIASLKDQMKKVPQAIRWHSEGSVWSKQQDGVTELRAFDSFGLEHKNGIPTNLDVLRGWTPVVNGTVWDHTKLVVQFASEECWVFGDPQFNEEDRFLIVLGAFLHDIGKVHSKLGIKHHSFKLFEGTEDEILIEESIPKVVDHPIVGIEPAKQFCKALKMSNEEIDFITYVVEKHMDVHTMLEHHSDLDNMRMLHHPDFDKLVIVASGDDFGSKNIMPNDRGMMNVILADEHIQQLRKTAIPEPILKGTDLISFGRKPGPLFKKMLEVAYHFQVDQGKTDKQELYRLVKNVELNKDGK